MRNAFVEGFVAHHHRRGAATGQALDELDRELAVLRRLNAVLVRIETELVAKMFVQRVRAAQRAAQRTADSNLIFPDRLLPENRVKRDQLINIDWLQAEFLGGPLDRRL